MFTSSSIRLTIAIPAYNRAQQVQALLKSILEQVHADDEVIVSDDASSDGTSDLAQMPGVRVLRHQVNQGMVANWNECLRAATKEWICILHDDDLLMPGALENLRHACFIASGPALITHKHAAQKVDAGFQCSFSTPSPAAVLSCPTIPSGAVVHATVVKELGLFDPYFKYSADLEYFARIAAQFPSLVIKAPEIVRYRLHGSNHQFKTWMYPDFLSQLEELQQRIVHHAGIEKSDLRRTLLEQRVLGDLFYMLDVSAIYGSRGLVRQVAQKFRTYRHRLSFLQKIKVDVAALTGLRLRWQDSN